MAMYICSICGESASAGENHICSNTKGAITKYRKKPVEIEAIQWNGNNYISIALWSEDEVEPTEDFKLKITTLEGTMTADIGDYIIKGVNGEFYPCKPDIFEKTYDLA
jgi:hypothetical protein